MRGIIMRRFVLLPLALVLIGCADQGPKIANVSGRVTLDGQPLANAAVMFSPVAPKGSITPGPDSGAKTDASGRYTLELTGKGKKGAVVGKHTVRLSLIPDEDPTDDTPKKFKVLPPKYTGKTSKLEYELPAGGTDTADFPLSSKPD